MAIYNFNKFKSARILSIGDIMLDSYIYGEAIKLSPEAPAAPVLKFQKRTSTLGGSGNVVRNIHALGAVPLCVGVIGTDENTKTLQRLVGDCCAPEDCLLLTDKSGPSTVKLRIMASRQQIARIDHEGFRRLSAEQVQAIIGFVTSRIEGIDVIAVSDYGKGTLSPALLEALIRLSSQENKKLIVDPKGDDYSRYAGAYLITPNRKELGEASRMPVSTHEEIVAAAVKIKEKHSIKNVLTTLSEDGMLLLDSGYRPLHIPSKAREIYDVSGAGDTVVAAISAGLASGFPLEDACRVANVAASIVVGKAGTSTTTLQELILQIKNSNLNG